MISFTECLYCGDITCGCPDCRFNVSCHSCVIQFRRFVARHEQKDEINALRSRYVLKRTGMVPTMQPSGLLDVETETA